MELVYVEWEDASAVDDEMGWIQIKDAKPAEVHVFRQAGFVYAIDDEALVLTEAHSKYMMSPRTRIPLGMIRCWVSLDEHVPKAPQPTPAPGKRRRLKG